MKVDKEGFLRTRSISGGWGVDVLRGGRGERDRGREERGEMGFFCDLFLMVHKNTDTCCSYLYNFFV
ncbi:MAG: hypothetical protein LBH46_03395 [Rickettsiales bacterium]|jgi:hypothetical protein|nr:hypothetical protein [Rickettsiales bacterium]